ncbi:MAG TPA: hypothetical protein VMW58_07585 [Anaerolineae bacterium]|nr:hypothetical protein [Anaerolineae bacterium]
MREGLLDSLIRPQCREGAWDVRCSEAASGGIVGNGEIVCNRCQARYECTARLKDALEELDNCPQGPRAFSFQPVMSTEQRGPAVEAKTGDSHL